MLPGQQIAWAEFAPDMSDYSPQYSDAHMNVEPRADGYGPIAKLATFGTALPARCLGAFNFRKSDGASQLFAGTATRLYRYNVGTASWDNVTRSSGGDYATPDGNYWNFAQFGGRLVAVNGSDATQYFNVDGGGTNFVALTNAPIAKYVATVGDFLMFGNLSSNINAIAWSGINDSEYYTYGFKGSDTQTFPDGGFVQGIAPVPGGALIFQRDKVRALTRVQGNLIFTSQVLHDATGCFAPQSIVATGAEVFWYDQSGFRRGEGAQPIGSERVNRYVTQIADAGRVKRIRGCVDPVRSIVWWIVDTSTTASVRLGYDWELNKWTQSDDACDIIFPAITPGYTIDSIDSLFGSMDAITIPFDATFWQGTGVLALAGFTVAGGFGYFQGFNLPATLETHDIELNPGNHAFLQSARVVTDCDSDSINMQVGTRQWTGETVVWSGNVTPSSSTGRAFMRKRGKYHRIRVNIGANAFWSNANGVMVFGRGAGSR